VNPYLQERRKDRAARLGPIVREIKFVGNETFTRDELLAYMATRESNLFATYRYNRRTLGRDLDNLGNFYVIEGFYDAELSVEDVQLRGDGLWATILIGIHEGDRWHVSEIGFEGEQVISEVELREATSLRVGSPFRLDPLESDRLRILDAYAARSYLDARVFQEVVRDDVARTAAVHYRIVEREQARMLAIEIVGNEKTREFVIARELEFSEGELFDSEKIGLSQAHIYRTGLFSSVWIEPSAADTGKPEKGVVVRLTEVPSGAFDLSAGYAALDGFEVRGGVSNRNLQGQAVRLGTEVHVAELRRGADVSVRDPWFLGVPVVLDAGASYEWNDKSAYVAETSSGSFVVTKSFGKSVSVEGGYEFDRTVVLRVGEGSNELGANYTTTVLGALTYDTRNDILNTRRGMLARLETELASSRLGGTNDFLRTDVMWRGFLEVLPQKIAAISARVGWINPHGDGNSVPVNERYFAGGEGSVRGFRRNTLSPLGTDGVVKGGRGIAEFRAEARFPLYKGLRMVAFVDAGQAYEDFSAITSAGLAVGAGGGLRYATRVGVVRLDVAAPVTESGPAQFYFGIGQAF